MDDDLKTVGSGLAVQRFPLCSIVLVGALSLVHGPKNLRLPRFCKRFDLRVVCLPGLIVGFGRNCEVRS